MNTYSETVAKIANDYLSRVGGQLRLVPARERDEFLRELESHIYEAYQHAPGDDDVARILLVLRNLGEPAEVVADRLPESMVRSGTRRSLPMHILTGILLGLFGVPLGVGGVGVLLGVFAAVASAVLAYIVLMGSMFLTSGIFVVVGLARAYMPGVWDRLVANGYIRFDGIVGAFMAHQTASGQALFLFLFAAIFAAIGWWLWRAGKHLMRGLRFFTNLVFDWMRRAAQRARVMMRRQKAVGSEAGVAAPHVV
jgi:uncharacterized membrane protein